MIIWNKVTWYSKLLSVIFLIIILPLIIHYLFNEYESIKDIENRTSNTLVNPLNKKIKEVPESIVVSSKERDGCFETKKYTVITRGRGDSVGSDILVKYKTQANQKVSCEYIVDKNNFDLKSVDAEYVMAVEGDYLITDLGTAPDPRGLKIYNLKNKKEVFSGRYSKPVEINSDSIKYWKPIGDVPTKENCPDMDTYISNGLRAGIESFVTLKFSDLSVVDSGQKRCKAMQ